MNFTFKSAGVKFKERDLTLGYIKNRLSRAADMIARDSNPITPPIVIPKQFPDGYMYDSIILFNNKLW